MRRMTGAAAAVCAGMVTCLCAGPVAMGAEPPPSAPNGSAAGAALPADVAMRANYCLEVVDRSIAEIDATMADPEFKQGLREAAKSGEFSYIPATFAAKKGQYRTARGKLSAYLRKHPLDKDLVPPLKALADTDVKAQNFKHLMECDELSWLQ